MRILRTREVLKNHNIMCLLFRKFELFCIAFYYVFVPRFTTFLICNIKILLFDKFYCDLEMAYSCRYRNTQLDWMTTCLYKAIVSTPTRFSCKLGLNVTEQSAHVFHRSNAYRTTAVCLRDSERNSCVLAMYGPPDGFETDPYHTVPVSTLGCEIDVIQWR